MIDLHLLSKVAFAALTVEIINRLKYLLLKLYLEAIIWITQSVRLFIDILVLYQFCAKKS